MNKIRKAIPQIVFVLITSLLCMTYITDKVVQYQIIIFSLLLFLYLWLSKLTIPRRYIQIYGVMVVFSVLYFLRAFIDLEVLGVKQTLFGNDYTVFVFLFFGAILQFVMIPRIRLSEKNFSWAFFLASIMILGSLIISFSSITSGNVVMTGDGRIQAGERLGVIEYGHLGLTSVIMGVVMLMKRKESKLFLIISPLLLTFGLFSIIMAGTRSAMVGLFLILMLFFSTRLNIKSLILSIAVIVLLYVVFSNLLVYTESIGANSAVRMLRFLSEGGDQSSGRLEIWNKAIDEILASPLLGVSCFISFAKYNVDYVHNSFIEVAYSLGLVGFILFIIINIFAISSTFKIFKQKNVDYMCFAMLYIQYFVYTLFSESIVRLPEYWYFLAMVICIGFNYLPANKK